MELTKRQKEISKIVEEEGPITGQALGKRLEVTRAALRSDLAILTMIGLLDARPKVGYYYTGNNLANPLADKLETFKVKDYMSQPIVVDSQTTVHDAIVTMFLADVGSLLVAKDEYLEGIISRKDLLRCLVGNMEDVPLTMIMTPVSKIVYAESEDPIIDAAERLIHYEVDCLPVIAKDQGADNKKFRIVGRLSKTNITKLFVECGRRYPKNPDI